MKKIFLIGLLIFTWQLSHAQISESDFQVLKSFYEATGGSEWKNNSGWDFSKDAKSVKSWEPEDKSGWYGLTIDKERVIGISLSDNNLSGSLPDTISRLAMLRWLALSNNRIEGEIPKNIGNLSLLSTLMLYNNKMTGALPSSFVNMGKDVTAPKKESDGFDEKSKIYINLSGNKFKNIDTSFLQMPLLNKDCGFIVGIDKKSFKGKTPACFKKSSRSKELVYSKNYIVERIEDEPIFDPHSLDELPKFEGKYDIDRFRNYITEYLVFPKNQVNLEQRIVISFVVNKDGKIFIRKISGDTRNNARKLVLDSEQYWQAGMLNGKPVSTTYTLPVIFSMR